VSLDVMSELEELRAEVRSYREAFTAMQWAHRMERFHALDAIKDDTCPCCSAPVRVEETPNSVKLHYRDAPLRAVG
jgi:hypothetical protein